MDFKEMQNMQTELQTKYKNSWSPIGPETGKDKLLWMMIEAGEVADIIKKSGNDKICNDIEIRNHFIEEMCDVMMYFNDIMACYNISPEELESIYKKKHEFNMQRWES